MKRFVQSLGVVAFCLAPAVVQADLFDNFDPAATGVTANQAASAPGPVVTAGGPTGNFLRLVNNGVNSQLNFYGYDRTATGAFGRVTANFDFRGFSADQPADGFAYVLLPTATYGISGAGPTYVAEDPNLAGTFGVGFDTHPGATNTVSVHFGSELVTMPVALTDVSFRNNTMNHALIEVQATGTGSAATVRLTSDINGTASPTVTPIINLFIPGMVAYENRVQFGGRTGGADMTVDLDNIGVAYGSVVKPQTLGTQQGFDSAGTFFITTDDGGASTNSAPSLISGGPSGNFLRLTHDGVNDQSNSLAFDSTYQAGTANAVNRLAGSFDFRGTSIGDPADGFSMALLPTASFGTTGPGPAYTGEEPDIAGTFALGFDFHPTATQNSISAHWNGAQVAENNTIPFNLDNGEFHHLAFSLEEVAGGVLLDVNVIEDVFGTPGTNFAVFNDLFLAGANIYDFRTFFRGRTGGLDLSVDLDNISVQLVPEPRTVAMWTVLGAAAAAFAWRKRSRRKR